MSRHARRATLLVLALVALVGVAGPVAPASASPITGTLTTSATATVWSQYVTLTATPTVPKGEPKPTGTVTFADEAGTIGSVDLANGIARLRTKALSVGTHVITVDLNGGPFAEPVTVTVGRASTTTTLVSKKAVVDPGSTAWFQATVAAVAPATTTPTGSVAFTLGGASTPAATVPLVGGIASWRPRLATGTHSVTAAFVPTDTHQASANLGEPLLQTVGERPPAGQLDQAFEPPTTGNAFAVGSTYVWHQTFTAGRTGVIDRVQARMDGWSGFAPVTISVRALDGDGRPTGPALGSGTITVPSAEMVDRVIDVPLDVPVAVRTGTGYALAFDSPVNAIGIVRAVEDGYADGGVMYQDAGEWYSFPGDIWFRTFVSAPTATVASSVASPVWSQYTDLTATWSTYGAVTPTGTITFLTGGTELGTAPIVNGVARLRTKALPAGTDQVVASYSGDADYQGGLVNGSATVYVGQAQTTTTLVSKKTEVLSGTAWFQAKVATVAPATAAPGGSVEFYLDGATEPAATVPLSAGLASWRPRLADGPHTIVATYVSSDQGGTSTSDPVEQSIGTPASSPVDQANVGPATGFEFIPMFNLVAQSFTVGRSGLLDSVTLDFPTAGQTVSVDIWTDGFIQPGVSTGTPQTIQTQQGATTVVFDTPRPVQAGETYYIVIDASQATGDTPTVSTTGNTYGAGQVAYYDFQFGTWDSRSWQDLVFSTTVRPA